MSRSAPRTDFGKPPPGYIPGLGRGAVGFTTRSDIGPARSSGGGDDAPPGFAGRGRGRGGSSQEKEEDLSESTFDSFSGFSQNLFANTAYEADDKEADDIYMAIDMRMDEKRKSRIEAREEKEKEETQKKRPKIADELRPYKKALATLSEDEWQTIPDSKDLSGYNKIIKKQREKVREKFTSLPDTVLASALGAGQTGILEDGPDAGDGSATVAHDLTSLSQARGQVMKFSLDRVADSVSGKTVVDATGYMTSLNSIAPRSVDDVTNIKKAETLLTSIRHTNPKHHPAWIAAARLAAETGKIVKARQIIQEGCKNCPKAEDIWLEAARLNDPANARGIISRGVTHCPTSVSLWIAARDLETTPKSRKAVLRRALDMIPKSVQLWKAAVEEETPENARILLSRAVECVPESVDLWLALARLETYDNARKVLNKARRALPHVPEIWITAAKLEEAAGKDLAQIGRVVAAAVKALGKAGVVIKREKWLDEAETAERGGHPLTCRALVSATVGIGVEDQDRKNTWVHDAETFISRGSIETARATYDHLLTTFPGRSSLWLKATELERQFGDAASIDSVLARGCSYCPQAEELWRMRAKEKWSQGHVNDARLILAEAFKANPGNEAIQLEAVRLESENNEVERARMLLERARSSVNTPNIWMKLALLERQQRNRPAELEALIEGVKRFKAFSKMWMMLGQHHLNQTPPDVAQAKETFKTGLKYCSTSADLWLCYAHLEVSFSKNLSKARSLLESARLKIKGNACLWLESIRVEQRAGQARAAEQLMARAMQDCNDAEDVGRLWAHKVAYTEGQKPKRAVIHAAIKNGCEDGFVCFGAATLFWATRKIKAARDWYQRAVSKLPLEGDIWAHLYRFEQLHGTDETVSAVRKDVLTKSPKYGELWVRVSKDPTLQRTLAVDEILERVSSLIKEDNLFVLWRD